ncbi:hypothetical protein V2J09_006001 [Rumex salicifolius]
MREEEIHQILNPVALFSVHLVWKISLQ